MNNFYGFLTKKGKNIFLITLLSTALLFASCINDLFNDDKSSKKQETQTEQTGYEELIPVKINISNKKQIENILQNVKPQKNISQARAASPQNVTLKYKILYKKVTDTSPSSTVTAASAEYTIPITDSASAQIELSKGTWDFTLIAYYTDADTEKVVFTGDLLKQEITPGNNTLNFTLKEPDSGKGNISITLKLPALTDYVTSVKVQLKTSSLNAIDDYDESEYTINSGNPFVYSLNNVPHGNYFVVFSIKTTYSNDSLPANTDTSETTVYPVPVRVVTNLTSESEETLTKIRNVCVITYDLGTDGTVSWTAAPERVYTKYQNVTLPTYEKLAPIETKIFNGWKYQDGTKVTSPMNITQNVTLQPDWITTTLYVDRNSTDTAVKTLQDAVNKLVTYEALDDGDDTSYQHEWTINVNGTCSGTSDISSLKITKLTITGDNNTQDILDGDNSNGSVITNEGTYPLYIKNLTIQKGRNTSGGGLNITNSTAYLNNVILTGNTSSGNGGGLFISNSTAYLNNVVLINNTASVNGGAIALTKSKLFIYGGCQIGPETATNAATDTACSNKAGISGGGIYADKDSTIYLGYTAADEANGTMTTETSTPSNIITYNYAGGPSESTYGGGGIYCLGKLYINGGTISYNRAARKGGGIYTKSLSMKGSTVSNNAATYEGGAIYIEATQTTKSFITSADFNGTTTSTKIIGNTSGNTSDNTSTYCGGGISFWGELYISNTIISGNKVNGKNGQGGGIYVNSDPSSKLFLYGETTIGATSANKYAESVSASSNSAAAGGGIYLCTSASAFLNYSSENATAHTGTVNITYNYVQTDFGNLGGGGIFADSSSKLYIAPGTTINYNATNMNGGGIFGKGTTYMSGGTIYGNNAKYGGGICLSGRDYKEYGLDLIHYGTLYMYGEAIIGTSENPNSAVYGGGIYLANSYSQAYLGDGENNLSGGVSYNKAVDPDYDGLGGGIYNKGLLQVSSGSISNNISKNDGGGVYNETDAKFYMYGGTIASNTAKNGGGIFGNGNTTYMSGGTIYGNNASLSGGGIYLAGLKIDDSTYYGTLYMYGNAIIGTSENPNSALYGGGIYLADIYSKAYLGDGENNLSGGVSYNKALATTDGGGGIYNIGLLQVSTGSISNNISKNDGGGVYNVTDAKFFMYGGTIASNTADSSGGGIYNSGILEISAATIESNTAKNGGGVYNKGIFDVSSGNIKSNTVTENGGGIYTTSDTSNDKTVLENSEITKNAAVNGGGVYIAKGKLDIKGDTIFRENKATGKGGAISGAIGEENEYSCSININDQGTSAYAYIKPDPDCNDVYLGTYSYIILNSNTLSPDHYYIARFTPSNYDNDVQYIYNGNNNSYKKFLVTPQTVTDPTTGMTTQVLWETTDEGKITKSNTTFVKIPAAEITEPVTGSGVFVAERPTLKLKSYYICDHEVTQGEYEKYCTYTDEDWYNYSYTNSDTGATYKVKKGNNYPACFVSWYDALVYCNLRSIAEGLEPVYYFETTSDGTTTPVTHPEDWGVSWKEKDGIKKYYGPTGNTWSGIKQNLENSGWRLPLEAEWEYAARAAYGTNGNLYMQTFAYSGSNKGDEYDDEYDKYNEVAWMYGNSQESDGIWYIQLVKTKKANSLGLYDMSGNVVELCWDWYKADLTNVGVTGPESPDISNKVAAPGGAYQYNRDLNTRSSNSRDDRFNNAGFRIVRTIKE